jgi:CubicO group peptidase (beta-lactamase class C family)
MWLKPTVLAFAVISIAAPALASDPLPRAAPGEVGLSPGALARIGEVLKADVDKGRIPGAVVAIARKGKLAYFEAFGFRDKAAGVPRRPIPFSASLR